MAANQPGQKDLTVLKPGMSRGLVLAEFGQPAATENKPEGKVDIFSFVQGYSKVNKGVRAVGHGVADVMTLGLWEVVGTPGEMVFDGDKMVIQVDYDRQDLVKESKVLQKKVLAGDSH
jgi:hypothetical protein